MFGNNAIQFGDLILNSEIPIDMPQPKYNTSITSNKSHKHIQEEETKDDVAVVISPTSSINAHSTLDNNHQSQLEREYQIIHNSASLVNGEVHLAHSSSTSSRVQPQTLSQVNPPHFSLMSNAPTDASKTRKYNVSRSPAHQNNKHKDKHTRNSVTHRQHSKFKSGYSKFKSRPARRESEEEEKTTNSSKSSNHGGRRVKKHNHSHTQKTSSQHQKRSVRHQMRTFPLE